MGREVNGGQQCCKHSNLCSHIEHGVNIIVPCKVGYDYESQCQSSGL